ncbi:MAG: DUF2007 domain-containing protein [Burkholderiales bacterium]|jgi:hypothetical protein|nr:DUF2007 domain-containing protein [Burkholderiales bacterium]
MKRLTSAPNLALATLWADQLCAAGIDASVQRAWAGSIAGEIPPDQALPEVWVTDEARHAEAQALLHELRHPPWHEWVCRECLERVEGPFEVCWNCGTPRPGAA